MCRLHKPLEITCQVAYGLSCGQRQVRFASQLPHPHTWRQDHAGPEVFCFPIPKSDILAIDQTDAYALRLTGLEGSRLLEFWHEGRGDWGRVDLTTPLHINSLAPFMLLRRPDAFSLHGLGQAIEYLEEQRASSAASTSPPVYPRAATSAEMRLHRVRHISQRPCHA